VSKKFKKENLLTSWKEIASYLDRDVRSCQRWEKKLGLPVYRIDKSPKSKVFAYKDEIDEWLRHRFKNKELPKNAFETRRKIFYIGLSLVGILIFLFSFFFYKKLKIVFSS